MFFKTDIKEINDQLFVNGFVCNLLLFLRIGNNLTNDKYVFIYMKICCV